MSGFTRLYPNDTIKQTIFPIYSFTLSGERGGSVVECRTSEREVWGSKPTSAVLCPWARHFTPRKYWLITQEAVAPSRHDWKIVDWDVKPQHKQTNFKSLKTTLSTCGFLLRVTPSAFARFRVTLSALQVTVIFATFEIVPGVFE